MSAGSELTGIAVVGMAGRFPGAPDVDAFWANLVAGVESIEVLDAEALRAAGVPEALAGRPDYVPACAFLEEPDRFDAAFFAETPREAELLDPQQRIFLECAWAALEDAGHDPARFPGAVGVFAGTGKNHYQLHNLLTNPRVLDSMGPVAVTIASEKDFVATRTSYKLDLTGPSVSVQTACSTSLVAVHLACQSLLAFECDMALAGGVSVTNFRREGYRFVEGGIFSPDGHLRAFDAAAQGQVGGNGAAVVTLKRLEDALADGDTIRAVIRGSAVNNDGVRKVSFNAPAVEGQARVVAEALEVADVDPDSIGYVECHGTGTHLGDPIEVAALTQAFRGGEAGSERVGFCSIGSLKTNVGHLDAAAGAAGLIKAALALHHGHLPPSLHFETPNPELALETSPFRVQTASEPWPRGAEPRRCGVSSFGMGGTNAHAILEEAPAAAPTRASRERQLLVLSARSESALAEASTRLARRLADGEAGLALHDVAWTTQMGRRAFAYRRAVSCASIDEAVRRLEPGGATRCPETALEKSRPVAFLFSGQGSQHANMLRGLYESEPVYRTEVDRCAEALEPHLGLDLRRLLHPDPGTEEAAGEELRRTKLTQPALFVVEYALAKSWASFGIEPAAMLGHSIGEYVAATLAGVFELEAALELVAARGRLIGSLPEGGGMLGVPLSEEELAPFLPAGVVVAVVNAPRMCAAAGPLEALETLRKTLRGERVAARPLHTSHAFHSPLMDPVLAEFEACVRRARPAAPNRPVISCTTGELLGAEQATDPGYWVRHLREPVRFAAGVTTLLGLTDPAPVLLEVGPGQALTSLASLCIGASDATTTSVPSARHAQREGDDGEALLEALGRLWCEGVAVDWAGVHAGEARRRVPLPTYPFERQRYWIEPGTAGEVTSSAEREPDPADWFWAPSWRRGTPVQGAVDFPARVLLVGDRGPLLDALARGFADEEVRVVRVHTEDGVVAPGPGELQLDRSQGDPWAALVASLGDELPGLVVLGFSRPTIPAPSELAGLEEAEVRGFYEPMALAQALEARGGEPVRLVFVTSEAVDVAGDDLRPARALTLGVVKAVNAECRALRSRLLDVDVGRTISAQRIGAVVRELVGGTREVVAIRDGRPWWPGVERVRVATRAHPTPIPSPHPPGEDCARPRRLRPGAVLFVTGGYGGVGRTLAEGLVAACGARVALFGRTPLPEREHWEAWLAEHPADDETAQRIRCVQRMEERGGEVLLLRGDVTAPADVEAAIAATEERFGPIHGVVQAAGTPGAGLLALKGREAAASVLGPKVRGTLVLEEALAARERELDFFVLCSSLATALEGVGQVDYFAANAFLDAYAASRAASSGTPVSVGWEAWRDVGMAAGTAVPEELQRARDEALRTGLSAEEGQDVLLRVLATGMNQVLVSTFDLEARRRASLAEVARFRAGEAAPEEAPASHARPELGSAYEPPGTDTERGVAAVWAELLGIDRVGIRDDFFELGGNSLLLMQVSARLRSDFGVKLSMRELFETPTVASLAERVDGLRLIGTLQRGEGGERDGSSGTEDGSDPARGADSDGETEELRL